ncbi:MAG TPA: hypothetical protein VH592_01385 [Gemmataceae bacterium]|jgi:hypothetical protein
MRKSPRRWWIVLAIPLFCLSALSCRNTRNVRTYKAPPPPDIKPTALNYVDTDGFDELFETALTNQDPVVLIQTDSSRPDWGPRLNAWIAAWNQGGKVVDEPRRRVRMQSPLAALTGPTVNGETVREFRLLIGDLLTRADDLARRGSSWWTEERLQRRRVDLLKPYSLRFHMDENQKIQLLFFNGKYARYYQEVMDAMAMNAEEDTEGWSRGVTCSHCKGKTQGMLLQRRRPGSEVQ